MSSREDYMVPPKITLDDWNRFASKFKVKDYGIDMSALTFKNEGGIGSIFFWNKQGETAIKTEINAFENRLAIVLANHPTLSIEDENYDAFVEFWKENSFIILGKPRAGAKIVAQWDPNAGKSTVLRFGNSTSSDVIGSFRESFRIREDNADLQIAYGRALDFADEAGNPNCQLFRIGDKCLRSNSELNILREAFYKPVFTTTIEGESYNRLRIRADGVHLWGPGSADFDVGLARAGAGELMIGNPDFSSGATLRPPVDNSGSIGTDSYRWSLVRAVTVTQGDIGFGPEDQPCPICGEKFKEGDIVVLKVVKVLENGEFRARPVHLRCVR